MKCPKCGKIFDRVFDSCGTGTTWSLFKCRNCGQFVATGRIIPKEALDSSVVVFDYQKLDERD